MLYLYARKNFAELAQLVVLTWGEKAEARAKSLAKGNHEGVLLLAAVRKLRETCVS